jgi:hypothetical protein
VEVTRLQKFVGPDDLVIEDLIEAVFLELASGVDPTMLVRFLTEKVELPAEDAAALVGDQNARLQERMHAIADRLEQRDRPAELAGQLIDEGWPKDLAHAFVAQTGLELKQLAKDPEGRKQLLAKTRRRMFFGLAWFGGGALATWFTHYSADHGNNQYVLLAWGPILYGIILFAHSAFQWCRYKLAPA